VNDRTLRYGYVPGSGGADKYHGGHALARQYRLLAAEGIFATAHHTKRFADNDPVVRQQVTLPSVTAIPGNLPIKVGDDVIGGVGVPARWRR
jgi:hypothetical protein